MSQRLDRRLGTMPISAKPVWLHSARSLFNVRGRSSQKNAHGIAVQLRVVRKHATPNAQREHAIQVLRLGGDQRTQREHQDGEIHCEQLRQVEAKVKRAVARR